MNSDSAGVHIHVHSGKISTIIDFPNSYCIGGPEIIIENTHVLQAWIGFSDVKMMENLISLCWIYGKSQFQIFIVVLL